jgi:hypothetical protein
MTSALIITIGSRDIQIAQEKLQEWFTPEVEETFYFINNGRKSEPLARVLGQSMLNMGDLSKKQLEIQLPMIDAFFKYAIKQKMTFDECILVATDQEGSRVAERYFMRDTVHYASVIKSLLATRYQQGQKAGPSVISGKIKVHKVSENVEYLDFMFAHFQSKLTGTNSEFASLRTYDQIHVLNQGGIDSINNGLMLNLLYIFQENTYLYSVSESTQLCTPLQFGEQLYSEQHKVRAIQALTRSDFAALKHLAIPKSASQLAAYAEARVLFDLDAAQNHLMHLPVRLRTFRDQSLVQISLMNGNEDHLCGELYWNALLKFEQEAYVDFTQRFFRIIEQMTKTAALQYIGFEFEQRTWEKDIISHLEKTESAGLRAFLSVVVVSGYPLKVEQPTIPVFSAIIEYFDLEYCKWLKQFSPLANLRNKGIGAHGFSPISKPEILNAMQMDDAIFRALLIELGNKLKETVNPFDAIKAEIESELNR